MARYLIEAPHTKEECLQALDETLAKGPEFLNRFEWGCMTGEHTAWGTVEARDEREARELLPSNVRGKARVIQVSRISPDQIRSFHQR